VVFRVARPPARPRARARFGGSSSSHFLRRRCRATASAARRRTPFAPAVAALSGESATRLAQLHVLAGYFDAPSACAAKALVPDAAGRVVSEVHAALALDAARGAVTLLEVRPATGHSRAAVTSVAPDRRKQNARDRRFDRFSLPWCEIPGERKGGRGGVGDERSTSEARWHKHNCDDISLM